MHCGAGIFRFLGNAKCQLLALDVDGVVADSFRRNFFPPVRRLRRNRDDVALAQVERLSTFDRRSRHLVWVGSLGADHRSTRYERRLSIHHDEDVIGMLMEFHRARFPAIGQHDEARIAHDRPTFSHHGRRLVVGDIVNRRRDALSWGGRGSGEQNKHRE